MLVFFFPFFENLGTYVYDSMRARTVLFLKVTSATIFCTACARVLSLCMLARSREAARDGLAALGVLGGSAAKWTNVVWPIKSRQTNQQTNTHYSFIGIDTSRPCRTLFGYCPPPALGSRKADMKTLSFFFPTPYPCHVARKQLSSPDMIHGRQSCLCPVTISFMP